MRPWTYMCAVLLVVATTGACGKKKGASVEAGAKPGARGPRAFPVEVATAGSKNVDYTLSAVGTVSAFEEVEVTARVAGVVEKLRFTEGDVVKQGQPLVEIETARYQLAVRAARAQLAKAEAAVADARAGLERREAALRESPGLVPGEEIETFRTRVSTAQAEAQAAKVSLEQAELNLRDAYVKAPIAGEMQSRRVRTGQYVQPGTVIGTLVRRDPLLLRFSVPEPDAARVKVGDVVRFESGARQHEAKITFVAAAADPGSRTVQVTAEVGSPGDAALRPGAFARVTIGVGGNAEAVLIPEVAIRPSEDGFIVFVVEGDKARRRIVELGLRTADGMVEVRSGVKAGELVVVRGAEALREGVTVNMGGGAGGKPADTPGAPAAPAGGAARPPEKAAP